MSQVSLNEFNNNLKVIEDYTKKLTKINQEYIADLLLALASTILTDIDMDRSRADGEDISERALSHNIMRMNKLRMIELITKL
jgi:hypothetical protein